MKTPALTLAAVLSLPLALTAQAQEMDHAAMGHDASGASKAYMDAMSRMDTAMEGMTMTGKPGPDFAAMMIPHHQAAIDMAKAYLAGGEKDPELVKMSNEIIAAQEREIAALRAWQAKHGD